MESWNVRNMRRFHFQERLMHGSAQMFESHAVTESDTAKWWVRNETGDSTVTLGPRNINKVVLSCICGDYFEQYSQSCKCHAIRSVKISLEVV